MKTFTIDNENNISVFATHEEAAAATTTPSDSFTSPQELGKLAAAWPIGRLAEVWNGFAGVAPFGDLKPVTKFTDRKTAIKRIWTAIQKLAEAAEMEQQRAGIRDAEAKLKATQQRNATAPAAPPAADVAPPKGPASKKATPAKAAPKGQKTAKVREAGAPREGSKTAQVVAMLQREGGATLAEIMEKMGWQRHTVRGFMAGAMKKAGHAVESFKPEGGERTYRITK